MPLLNAPDSLHYFSWYHGLSLLMYFLRPKLLVVLAFFRYINFTIHLDMIYIYDA